MTDSLKKISRAEVIRRFGRAQSYRLISRERGDGRDSHPVDDHPREIARVTTTGVYVVNGPEWAITTFDKGVEYFDNGDRIAFVSRNRDGSVWMTLTYELAYQTKEK